MTMNRALGLALALAAAPAAWCGDPADVQRASSGGQTTSQRQFIRLPSTGQSDSSQSTTTRSPSSTAAVNPGVALPQLNSPSRSSTASMAHTPKPPARPAPGASSGIPGTTPGIPNAVPEMPGIAPFPSSNRPAPSGMPGMVSGGSAPELPAMVAPSATPATERMEQGQLLVAWPDAAQAQQGLAFIRSQYGLDPSATAAFANLGLTIALFQLPRHEEAIRLKDELARAQPSWTVDFNTLLYAMSEPRHYALAQIGYAPTVGKRASGARIGVLDSDIEEIPALRNARITIQDFVGQQEGQNSRAHGTAIASLLVGVEEKHGFRGIAAGAEVKAAAIVMQRNGRGVTNAGLVVSGLDWVLGQQVRVVNISLGGPENAVMALAIKALTRRSVAVVAAAGNDGPKGEPLYPAAYPEVIAATAVDARENVFERASQGQHVLISAPGVDVWVPDAAQGRYVSGTSFAAAHVSATLALLRAAEPRAAPSDLKERLCGTAKNLGEPGRDPVFGCGLLQIARALSL